MGDLESPKGKRLEQTEKRSKVPEKTSDHHNKSHSGPRQSELKTQVDVSAVLDEILDTPVPLTIQKSLGTSKELSHGMHDRVKFKNQSRPAVLTEPGRPLISHNVNSQTMHGLSKYQSEAAEELIHMTFYCHGRPITAVIDTCSEINVVNSTIATERIPLPMDTRSSTTMADANGGKGYLKGLINGVSLTCGAVKTVCDMFVEDTVPFDLLLGQPWQIHNKVTIDKRCAGTYLVFKGDQDVPRYEVHVPPEGFFQRSALGKKKVQVITVIQENTRKPRTQRKKNPLSSNSEKQEYPSGNGKQLRNCMDQRT